MGWILVGQRREHLGPDHALEVGADRIAGAEDQGVAVDRCAWRVYDIRMDVLAQLRRDWLLLLITIVIVAPSAGVYFAACQAGRLV